MIEELHEKMLDAIPDKWQKTIGFPAYDFSRAFAVAVYNLMLDIETAEKHLDVNNLTGDDLDTYIEQRRGLERKYQTYAMTELTIVSGSGSIRAGDIFSTASGVDFYAMSDGTYSQGEKFQVHCYSAGSIGNVDANTIVKMPITIVGIAAVTNELPATGGYDEETDNEYRERYYLDLRLPNNGANKQAYITWATFIDGVGRAKVFPQAQGPNSVEVCIVGADMGVPSSDLVQRVQAYIDPNRNGDGSGEAPIGAVCTVTPAVALKINISVKITVSSGYNLPSVTESVKVNIKKYLNSIAFLQDFVSYGKIGNAINDTDGVADYANLRLNGSMSNISLIMRQTPVLGTVSAS